MNVCSTRHCPDIKQGSSKRNIKSMTIKNLSDFSNLFLSQRKAILSVFHQYKRNELQQQRHSHQTLGISAKLRLLMNIQNLEVSLSSTKRAFIYRLVLQKLPCLSAAYGCEKGPLSVCIHGQRLEKDEEH